MTTSSWKAEFARLGPTQVVDRVQSGSAAVLAVRPSRGRDLKTVSATLSLVKRGLTMLRAKRAIEEALDKGRAVIALPALDDEAVIASELEDSGFSVAAVTSEMIDLKSIRERMGLSQEQFAIRYGLDVDAVQNWESGRRRPDKAARSYLRVIASLPDAAGEALEVALPRP